MTELYPSDADLNAMSGEADTGTQTPYPAIGESPYYLSFYKMLYRLLDTARRAGDLRVYKDGPLTFGVRAGRFADGNAVREYPGSGGNALSDNAVNCVFIAADGTLATAGEFPDVADSPHIPLAVITAAGGDYSHDDIVDMRGLAMFRCRWSLDAGAGNKAKQLFDATDITAEELQTLSGGQNADADLLHTHPLKADKVVGATEGNLAGLDADGNLTDSGMVPGSLADYQAIAEKDAAYGYAGLDENAQLPASSLQPISGDQIVDGGVGLSKLAFGGAGGSVYIGGGDITSTAAHTSSQVEKQLTGAAVGDIVLVGPASEPPANTCWSGFVLQADMVCIRFNNYSAAAVDPGAVWMKVLCLRP